MIDLNEDNDPMLFSCRIPSGTLVVQYMEAVATLQESCGTDAQPTIAHIAAAIRKSSRTPEVAQQASDAHLIAAWHRMTAAVAASGNG